MPPRPEPEEPAPADPLVELVAGALAALEEGGPAALDAFCRAHPAEADVVRRRVALLGERGLSAERGAARSAGELFGDFRLLRPLGGGGMGVVWLAEQRSLGREVALKLVRPDQLLFPGARERFRREVETVARLQHPGIVPVYAVGEDGGLPWFAMELVRGLSLGEALHALAGRDPAALSGAALAELLPREEGEPSSALFDGPWPEVCTRIAREVAEALEHARRRGIVHRDVKPSNVMITRGGRVLLLDFGLSSRAGDPRITRAGSAVGSLAYMPPELLRGEGGEQDPRQDVYSLGATLYELLALRPAFPLESQAELLRAIERGATPLRRARPEVSWELSTIAAVAMDPDPGRRYPHAGALARDLANALERRPIEARPPGPALRLRRWVERHPARAVLLAALIVAPSALLAREVQGRRVVEGKNAELARANGDLAAALADSRAQRELAQASFHRALDAVDRMLLRVGEDRLAGEPRMEIVQRELVTDALELYGWFLERGGDEPGLAHEVARVALAAGDLHGRLDELDEALGALDRGEALLRDLLAADPGDARAALSLAAAQDRRAVVLRLAGRPDEAQASARVAVERLEGLAALAPAEAQERDRLLASAHSELGVQLELAGDAPAGLVALERSVALLRGLPADGPEGARVRYDLARDLDLRGRLRAHLANPVGGRPDAAALELSLADHEEAAGILAELVDEEGGLPEPRFRRARALTNQVYVLSGLGQGERGMQVAREALAVQQALVADYPRVPVYASDLASTCVNLAAFHGQRGQIAEGGEVLEQGLRAFEAVLALSPGDSAVRVAHGTALVNLAGFRQAGGDVEGALEALGRAQAELDLALARIPDDRQARGTAWMIAYRRASTLLALGRPGEALEKAGGLLAHGPGLPEIETYAKLAAQALQAAPEEERAVLLARAAGAMSALGASGALAEEHWTKSPSLAALRGLDGFEAALATAIGGEAADGRAR